LENKFTKWIDNDWQNAFGRNKPNKTDLIIVTSRIGVRSTKAKLLLEQLGYTNVENNKEGAWAFAILYLWKR